NPLTASAEGWQWVPLAGTHCANGNATGFAINLARRSDELLVFFEGGGACHDTATCYDRPVATYIDVDYDKKTFETGPMERAALDTVWPLTQRDNRDNPYRRAHMAYIPYCTGDLHTGDAVVRYPGAPMPTHHTGAVNARRVLERLAMTFPNVDRVTLAGVSAGGFGALLHHATATEAFPGVSVDVVVDSGMTFAGQPLPASWGVPWPPLCAGCAEDFSRLVERAHSVAPRSRFAYLSYRVDPLLAAYVGVPALAFARTAAAFAARARLLPRLSTFAAPGYGHVVLWDTLLRPVPWLKAVMDD
ncbi:MAG TPA: pectin acetylesterase-family hydrolase, partial [Myxococcota bacterium]|nr:pectin acetylesterase-family hydrolase [Myxococcota bacterium]